jgi:hypothetical protein
MAKQILLAAAVVAGLAGVAHAQQPLFAPTMDSLCANTNNPNLTLTQQQSARLVCASPRLKANRQRNLTAGLAFFSKLPASTAVELAARLKARQAEHAAYCHVAENQQIPPSPVMETCLAYWQDQTYAEIQRGEQLVAQARSQAAVQGFLENLANGLGEMSERTGRNATTMAQPQPQAPLQGALPNPMVNCSLWRNGNGMSCQ